MSIPPQLIRVKRKRDEEVPVTFLQFDEGQKRHRSNSNWAYRRRGAASETVPSPQKPVIHVSQPEDVPLLAGQRRKASPARQSRPSGPGVTASGAELRRFHMSRSILSARKNTALRTGISKHGGRVPAIFVERDQNKLRRERKPVVAQNAVATESGPPALEDSTPMTVQTRDLKRAGAGNKARSRQGNSPTHTPLPASVMNRRTDEEMEKVAAEMDRWVLNEIGANLADMEERERRFRPKAPVQRYHERHPECEQTRDVVMDDASDGVSDDDDEWIVEEYVRIPANSVAVDVSPSDIGVLVLDDEDESLLFFGSLEDDEGEAEDEEDENAENHYTADYPEEEVESDDEFDRRAYDYRCGASDDEEFDEACCSDHYEAPLNDDDDDNNDDNDDDAKMERIRAFMRRHPTFG
ncbi:Transcription factor Iwr1 [Ophiocordyceps camponoti-floridani]|uniref:Transcription factor Iwr1 n=1 Tax=Ophiocordyceps camponoti-floridani TaxID=2030778 RepID=A0A8H4VB00_9HYPO|nr:Transcription factor Iwr1 [Ophiocordyceps camponoti-floridani]